MISLAKRRTLHLWIAMLAILFSALAPAVSHALAAGSSAGNTLMLCTISGYKLIQLHGDGDSKAPADAKSMQHCAFCTIHGGADALPATPAATLVLSGGRDIYPSLFYHAPGTQHIWSAAQQRAPPFLA
jgi:hypothetical protein